jgi:hypothetical protein
MNDDNGGADDWDFYPCVVDDRPASIFLNLRYEHARGASFINTLYWLRIQMLDAADHGMGGSLEAEALYSLEDRFIAAAASLGLVYVGRLRNDGRWQVMLYGPAGHSDALNVLAHTLDLGRQFETGSKPDPDWTYYRDFLMPNAERRQWMQDRRVLDVLEEHGDDHSIPRRIDHWAYFRTPTSRQAFVQDVIPEGFALEATSDDAQAFGAQVFRTDTVELDHIHEVVMKLFKLAEQHGGYYDGWEGPLEKPPSN